MRSPEYADYNNMRSASPRLSIGDGSEFLESRNSGALFEQDCYSECASDIYQGSSFGRMSENAEANKGQVPY